MPRLVKAWVVAGFLMIPALVAGPVNKALAESKPGEKPIIGAVEKSLAGSIDLFGWRLFDNILAETSPDSNVLISPLSAWYALTMTYNGAEGETRRQMATTLELPDLPTMELNAGCQRLTQYLTSHDTSLTVKIANSIWHRTEISIRPEFADLVERNFDAQIRALDFGAPGAVDAINGWVAEKTNGCISAIVEPPLDPEIVMFLINAVYFDAFWKTPFDPTKTQDADFHIPDGSTISCRMMNIRSEFALAESESFRAVQLPYGDERISMTAFLPNENHTIAEVAVQIESQEWSELSASFAPKTIAVSMPKFRFSDDHGLNQPLKAMGMTAAFTHQADFTAITDRGGMVIDSVIHKTFIKVDEKGTEAAAATAVGMRKGLAPALPTIVFDRPFLFLIADQEAGNILFIGKVAHPTLAD